LRRPAVAAILPAAFEAGGSVTAAATARTAMGGRQAWGFVLLAFAPLCMASNILTSRLVAGEIPPVGFAFWRWAVAFVLLAPFVGRRLLAKRRDALKAWLLLVALGATGMAICATFINVALWTTTATNAGLMQAASPIMILLLAAALYGDRLTWRQAAGVALAVMGVAAIVARGRPEALVELEFAVGDLWVIGLTVSWGVYTVLLRCKPAVFDMTELFALCCLTGMLALLPFYLWEIAAVGPTPATAKSLAAIGFVGLVPSILSYLSYAGGIAIVGPARAGPFLYLLPIYAAFLAWTFLGERLAGFHAAGAALILGGVWLASARGR
jgi:drug/metabolite transporter (DMT)-like permease